MATSGSGKSTLTATLLSHGARFGNDDLIPVRFVDDCVVAWPSVSLYPKVHKTGLEALSIDRSQLRVAAGEREEYWLPLEPRQRVETPRPLSALFMLQPLADAPSSELISARRLRGGEAVNALAFNMRGVWAVLSHVDQNGLRAQYARLAGIVPIYTLTYAKRFSVLPSLVNAIRELVAHEVTGEAAVPCQNS